MHNVTVCRSYRDGETWKNAYSFGPADLPPLAGQGAERGAFLDSRADGCGSKLVAWRRGPQDRFKTLSVAAKAEHPPRQLTWRERSRPPFGRL